MDFPLPEKSASKSEWLDAYDAIYQHYLSMTNADYSATAWCHEMVTATLGPQWWSLFGQSERTATGWKNLQSTAKNRNNHS